MKFLKFDDLVALGIVQYRPTLYRWIAKGRFPKPIKIGPKTSVWDSAEVMAEIERRKAERGTCEAA